MRVKPSSKSVSIFMLWETGVEIMAKEGNERDGGILLQWKLMRSWSPLYDASI
jgi:hypothetical protein